jgi:integrase
MKTARDLSRDEVRGILAQTMSLRNKALLVIGFNTGFRISEILSLTIADVFTGRVVRTHVTVAAKNMKNKKARTIKLNSDAVKVLTTHCKQMIKNGAALTAPLFPSSQMDRKPNADGVISRVAKSLSRFQVHHILKTLADLAGVDSTGVSSHSFRKTFAKAIYIASGKDLTKVQYALGHSSITITIKYLMFAISELDNLVDGLSYE